MVLFRQFLNDVKHNESFENLSLEKVIELVAVAFISSADQFQIYVEYCRNKKNSARLLLEDRNGMDYFHKKEQSHRLNGTLDSYLIRPVQRLARYKQLLKELIDCCPIHSKDIRCEIRKALEVIAEVLKNADDAVSLKNDSDDVKNQNTYHALDSNSDSLQLLPDFFLLLLLLTFCILLISALL